jgi:hypothetical protein
MALTANQDLKDQPDHRVRMVLTGNQDLKDQQVNKDLQAHKDHKAFLESQELHQQTMALQRHLQWTTVQRQLHL